jgi:hypothetical protein
MQKISFFLRGIEKVGITIHLLSFAKLSNLTQKISLFCFNFDNLAKESRSIVIPTFLIPLKKTDIFCVNFDNLAKESRRNGDAQPIEFLFN